ncbi:MAG TPA: PAS domain S-box protein [Bacteroidia bacterium]|nr:PAS domain S-box protein [Bacteroidia bacterium]
MHKLLKRQLEKYFSTGLPQSPELSSFLDSVNEAYVQLDERFNALEHTLEVTSEESFTELNNFRNVIDETAMVIVVNRSGYISYVNKSFCLGTGIKEQDIKKKKLNEFLSPENNKLLETAAAKLVKGQTWKGEISIQNNYGQTIWLHNTVVPLKDQVGKTSRYMSIMIDITSRKIFEDEIIRSEDKYKNVVNSINDILFQLDEKLELIFLNKAWTDITKFNIYESLGLNFTHFIDEKDRKDIEKQLKQLLKSKSEEFKIITKINTASNTTIWAKISGKLVRDQHGIATGISGTIRDVTETINNEDLLKKSYAFQQAILNSAKQAIIATDENGIISTINAGTEELFGCTEHQVVRRKKISDILNLGRSFKSAKSKTSTEELIKKAKEEGYYEYETIIYNCTSQKTDVLLSVSTIKDTLQNITGYLFILNDISIRKKTEYENIKLNKILEETPDFVVYYDLDNHPMYYNKSYKEIRYINDQETLYPIHPAWVDIIINKKAIPYAMLHGAWKGETAILDKNGLEIPVLQLIIIHKDELGNPIFRSSLMRDITQRKEHEKRILQSEKRNRDLINYSQASICTHDMQGNLLTINPAGCEITGYQMEEMIGRPITDFMKDEHRENFDQEYLSVFKKAKTAQGILILRHKEGRTIYMLYKNYKVEEQGSEPYIIGFAQDISDRIKIESELKNAKKIAEESLHTKELFLANMSHEIRTPMNGIVGLTNLLLKTSLNEKQSQYAGSVKQSAENLLVIINEILDFSKIQAGKLEILKQGFDLNNAIYNLTQTFLHEAQKKKIHFSCEVDDSLHPYLIGDQVRLNQVLVNLLGNAFKFTEAGTVQLTVKKLQENPESLRLRFEISDTGIGISSEYLEKIFQSFTQANADTSRRYGGTGLGLSIVKNLLNLMGSDINVTSTMGKGSIFSFEINFEKTDADKIGHSDLIEQSFTNKLTGCRILLAEDNKVNQLFAVELVSEWGAQIDIADNGKIAVDLMKEKSYDLVLMDIQMPEMSGIDATEYIRNNLSAPAREIPIIAMTANAMKGDEEKFLKAGMNAVIFKPFEGHELFNKMEPYLLGKIISGDSSTFQSVHIAGKVINNEFPEFTTISMDVLKAFSRGKASFIEKMVTVLNEAIPVMVDSLKNSIEKYDSEEIRHHSHKLIPNMNMLGNKHLEEQMKWIEDNALNPDTESEIKSRYLKINPILNTLVSELTQLHTFILNNDLSNYLKKTA